MNAILKPAVGLMNRLRYPQKFGLIATLFIVPMMLVMTLLGLRLLADIRTARLELAGTAYMRPLMQLFVDSLQESELSASYTDGTTELKDQLLASQAQVDRDFAALHEVDQRVGEQLQTSAALEQLQASWSDLKAKSFTMRSRQLSDLHTKLIADIRDMMTQAGDASSLVLDAQLDSYYTMDVVMLDLPAGRDLIDQLRVLGRRVAAQQGSSLSDRTQFVILSGLVEANIDATQHSLDRAFHANPELRNSFGDAAQVYTSGATDFVEQTKSDLIYASAISITPDAYTATASHALEANSALWGQAIDNLDRLIQQRIDIFSQRLLLAFCVILLGLLLALYICSGLYISLMQTVSRLSAVSQRMIRGEAAEMLTLDNRDELSDVARSFNDVATALIAASTQRQAVFEHAADGMLTLTEQGTIDTLNPAAQQIFGWSTDDLISRPLRALIPGVDDVVAAGGRLGLEGRRKDGSSFPLELAISSMHVGDRPMSIAIVHDLTERQRVEREREQIQEQIIQAQADALAELSTPLIPISDRVLVMPLIGQIDLQRADLLHRALLNGVERAHARAVILDITGVPVLDAQIAKMFLDMARGVQLLGARVILTGIQPEVAQTLVSLGIDLSHIVTHTSLQSGIAHAAQL